VSRAELLGVLSLVSDLGLGQPMQHALRQCLIAMRLGRVIGLDARECEAVFCAGLLAWVGCHVDAYEQAKWFGDEHAVKLDVRLVDVSSTAADLAFTLRHIGTGLPVHERARLAVSFFANGGMKDAEEMLPTHCAAANDLARGLGFGELVCRSIEQSFERWDGRGAPHGARGDDIVTTARLVNLADVVEVYHGMGGVDAAVEVARRRSGTQFDPDLVEVFCTLAAELFEELDEMPAWETVVNAEPSLARPLEDADLDAALEAVADFTDVKSPYTIGHSRGVADLAAAAAANLGLDADDAREVRRAGLLHDLGRVGVPNTVWDKAGPLGVAEQERVRLHPYLTGRTLASAPGLAPLGAIAAQHHERLDGSGYPRGLRREALGVAGRLLAAADMYCTKTEPRPHRSALPATQAAAALRAEVRAGRLDGETVEAVLLAAGHRSHRRQVSVAGLTPREIEVLRLLARGSPTKQIAQELGISRKTAANHVEHIYTKLGVTNRALASLFAAKHGLIQPDDPSGPSGLAGQVAGLA
jgi:HD-GYP domain-containing protein (c-di-GMP phosphodiesterase class II)